MRKRAILLLWLVLVFALWLNGCEKCEHSWEEASCEKPKTCSLCGATQGRTLRHTFADADCRTPKTCTVCGRTNGEALGHTWNAATCTEPRTCKVCNVMAGEPKGHAMQEANFQEPATCTRCDHTEGEPLSGAYAEYPVNVMNAQMGVEYDYHTACLVEGNTTLGKLTWENYRVFASDETHEAVDGYEWHSVTVKIVFSDKDAKRYGFVVQSALDDYYWIASEAGDGYTDTFSVSYYGQLYDQCLMANRAGSVSEWEDGVCTYTAEFAWRVPVGYDAHLILFYNAALNLDEALKNGEESLLVFRFAD